MTESRKRLTYLMLFRVGVVTFLLVATFFSELAAPAGPTSAQTTTLLMLIAGTYGLTIVFAVWLQRAQALALLAVMQVAADLVLATLLVHYTGGAESGFVFMYLLLIVASSFVLGGGSIGVAVAAVVLYAGLLFLRRFEVLATYGQPYGAGTTAETLRVAAINAVAFMATGMLGARLAVELRRAGERAESQGVRLRDFAAMHQDVIRCLTSGLLTVTREGTVITYNNAAAEILGVPMDDAIGRPIADLMPSLGPLIGAARDHGPLRRGEILHRGADGAERTFGISLSPLADAEGKVLGRIVNFQDLTELRRMEEQVERAERLAAVGRLAAGVAHEIRNPLAAISGSVELLARMQPAGDDARALMDIVTREASRLNGLITDLLDFARPRPPDLQPLDLAATVGELIRVFELDKALEEARVELSAGAPVMVSADAAQLRQVVWNLVRNAAQASPAGAPIVVTVKVAGTFGELTVRDHGPGIPPEQRAQVFEPFFSTKKGGTGLGLAVVHRIVEDHQGRIEIRTPTGGGTLMVVRLPLAPVG